MAQGEGQAKLIDVSRKPLWAALRRTWCLFCRKTSIHGLKFTNETSTNRIIRTIWWIITVTCFICSIKMVVEFYIDYRSNPTRINLESDHSPIASMFFPSVTVCPELLHNAQKSALYIETLKLPPMLNASYVAGKLGIIAGFMDNEEEHLDPNYISQMEQILQLNNLNISQFLYNIKWDCQDLLFRCRYGFQITPCTELFQVARTFYGYCCSFNLNNTGVKFLGLRARSGLREGLSIILHHNDSETNKSSAYSLGYRVLIDETPIVPSAQSVVKFVPFGEEVFAAIRPVETFCSLPVEALPIGERQCAFPFELTLQYFPLFSGPHCELDCRVINTLKYCECLPYYIPHNETKERTCSFKDLPCLAENFAAIIGRFRSTQCFCPNECEMMDYDVQVTNTELQVDIPTVDPFYDGIKKDFSVLHVFMNAQVYRRVRRDLLSNSITLVANLGSAFSLFAGMSMVSLVEIIYYFTVGLRKAYVEELQMREKMLFQKKSPGEVAY